MASLKIKTIWTSKSRGLEIGGTTKKRRTREGVKCIKIWKKTMRKLFESEDTCICTYMHDQFLHNNYIEHSFEYGGLRGGGWFVKLPKYN